MNNHPEPNPRDPLLDAILRTESWETAHAAAKAAALRELHAVRRRQWLSSAAVALAACLAAAVIWPTLSSKFPLQPVQPSTLLSSSTSTQLETPNPQPVTISSNQHSAISNPLPPTPALALSSPPLAPPRHISEAEMLALFPKGSCLIAEINGQEQLVFFDHQVEAQGAPYHPGS